MSCRSGGNHALHGPRVEKVLPEPLDVVGKLLLARTVFTEPVQLVPHALDDARDLVLSRIRKERDVSSGFVHRVHGEVDLVTVPGLVSQPVSHAFQHDA